MNRPLRFAAAGFGGLVLQLATLAVLTEWFSVHYLLATIISVEAAILVNFVWHERWTWSDRRVLDRAGVWRRLGRFQISSGVISIAGNVILTALIVACTGVPLLLANVLAVGACTIPNFAAADQLVFRAACRGQA